MFCKYLNPGTATSNRDNMSILLILSNPVFLHFKLDIDLKVSISEAWVMSCQGFSTHNKC